MEEDNYMSLKILNFETAIYVGEADDIEAHCNSILKEIKDAKDFLKMRSTIENHLIQIYWLFLRLLNYLSNAIISFKQFIFSFKYW